MKKLKLLLIPLALILGLTATALPVGAAEEPKTPAGHIQEGVNSVGGSGAPTLGSQVQIIINVLLFILGAIAVVMIVIGGIRFTTANGDSSQIKTARETVLYAVVGLVVALLAYAIVNFILNSF